MTTAVEMPAESSLHTDDVYTWECIPTPLGERYELKWCTERNGDCRGIVMQTGPYYDAYIEVRFGTGSTTQWAQMQFETAGDARAWVQNHMVE
jgi:hypothetical protein